MGILSYGEPSWITNIDGNWDFVPLAIAAVALLILRIVFRVRLQWPLVLVVILAAPLFRAGADRIGMPLAVAIALALTAIVVVSSRRSRPPGFPHPNV